MIKGPCSTAMFDYRMVWMVSVEPIPSHILASLCLASDYRRDRAFSAQNLHHSHLNNLLLVKIEGPVWYTIYIHLSYSIIVYLLTRCILSNPSIFIKPMGMWDNHHLSRSIPSASMEIPPNDLRRYIYKFIQAIFSRGSSWSYMNMAQNY